jgi:hypothetical protein
MTRLRGWAPKGERLVDKVPHGKWKTATFLAALRSDRIDAPCLFDGPINGERFRAYVDQFLAMAVRWRLLKRNPVDSVDPPKVEHRPCWTRPRRPDCSPISKPRMFMPVLSLSCVARGAAK